MSAAAQGRSTRQRLAGLVAGVVALFTAAGTAVAGEQDFTLVNYTGVEIYEVYVGPASSTNWGEDILGADTLGDEEEVEIVFDPVEDAELWDVRVVDSDGNNIDWFAVDLTTTSVLTLYYEDGRAWAETE